MPNLSPALLLERATPEAPWCATLDNLELTILLLAQPWATAGTGLRRAALERQLASLDLPLGPIYFQRIKRAVARLEEIGILDGWGEGRSRRFVVTPEGFAALLLNLCVLHADPTIDGSEFELKRSLVATLNHFFERLSERPEEPRLSPETEGFLADVERLVVDGEPVITEEIEREALNVLRLIDEQRQQVERLLASAKERQACEESRTGALSEADLDQIAKAGFGDVLALLGDDLDVSEPVDSPWLGYAATVLRYEQFLRYLDKLDSLYASGLKTVDIRGFLRTWTA